MSQNNEVIAGSGGMWDVIEGLRSWRLWAYMGLVDIRQRYRRSLLGPLWMALGLGATVIGIGLLYSQVLNTPADEYVPFIAISLLIWQFMTTILLDGTTLFATSSALITSVRLPYTSLVLRSIVRSLIVSAHGLLVVIAAFVFYHTVITPVAIFAILGLIIVCLNVYWMTLLISLLSARFRDVAQIFVYFISLMLFLTPVIWKPDQVSERSSYLLFNPLAHLIAIVREPVLEGRIPLNSLIVSLAMVAIGLPLTAVIFAKLRRYVAYWT